MTKNPLVNAFTGTLYIAFISLLIFYGPKIAGIQDKPDTVLAPIAMLSLFCLSASIMGYIFLGNPIQLFLEGQKKEGINLFLKTVINFAVITGLIFVVAFSGIF